MAVTPDVLLEFARTINVKDDKQSRQKMATVTRMEDGVAYVSIPGGESDVPLANTGATLSIGDVVTVSVDSGQLIAGSNISNPSIPQRVVDATARTINRAVKAVQQSATEAQRVASAVNQHFWSDGNGVHVTEAEGDATTEHNILINSLGILLRKATNYLVSITESAIAFYDGQGTASSNIVAQFGADGYTIGYQDSASSYQSGDYHSWQMVDRDGETYAYVSDLRNADGYVVESFTADGTTNIFELMLDVASVRSVTVDGESASVSTYTGANVSLSVWPSEGAAVVIEYMPSVQSMAKAYTFGVRDSDYDVGPMSYAEGYNTASSGKASHAEGWSTVASYETAHAEGELTSAVGLASHAEGIGTSAGLGAHAQNYHTKASSAYQTALGKYNVEDSSDTYAVIVGNGTSDSARSNALAVDWSGNIDIGGVRAYMTFVTTAIANFSPPSGVTSCLVLDTSDYGLYWYTA